MIGDRGPYDYGASYRVTSRLADNDQYGHINNSVYHQFFDSAVNGWLISATGTPVLELPAGGVVAANSCLYLRELRFPDTLIVGIDVVRVGRTSVSYELALFRDVSAPELCATGTFVHVYVDHRSRRPVPIPDVIRRVTSPLLRSRD